jgi:hypothetical protein
MKTVEAATSQFDFDHTHMMPIANAALKTCLKVGYNNIFSAQTGWS